MEDISNTLAIKRWWRFRTQLSLLAEFLNAKYCSRSHPVSRAVNSKDSQIWKNMLQARDKAECRILWKINARDINFWWDSWTDNGALAKLVPQAPGNSKSTVSDFLIDGRWNMDKIREAIPEHLAQQIMHIEIGEPDQQDYAIWKDTEDGKYSTKSAWSTVRHSKQKNLELNKVWHKSILFKISFLVWRLYLRKLPFDEVIANFGNHMVSRCFCCQRTQCDSIQHTFIEGEAACHVWKYFGGPFGTTHHNNWDIRRVLKQWWDIKPKNEVHRLVLQAMPVIIS
ncbi:uncharacterized protein LOC142176659 [Nicotiana tabacum]|uniref:Uncharacterized protein LOC142176659 n=1 Tax=Nicotiana tabacum TaxID=4097 RepID=A0AC58TUH1_TOBAC